MSEYFQQPDPEQLKELVSKLYDIVDSGVDIFRAHAHYQDISNYVYTIVPPEGLPADTAQIALSKFFEFLPQNERDILFKDEIVTRGEFIGALAAGGNAVFTFRETLPFDQQQVFDTEIASISSEEDVKKMSNEMKAWGLDFSDQYQARMIRGLSIVDGVFKKLQPMLQNALGDQLDDPDALKKQMRDLIKENFLLEEELQVVSPDLNNKPNSPLKNSI